MPRSRCMRAPPPSSIRARRTGSASPSSMRWSPRIPVLGNGDIFRAEDALAYDAARPAATVWSSGAAASAVPGLFRELADLFEGRPVQPCAQARRGRLT